MLNETGRNTLAPLILRLALGAIFLYHGLGKVTSANDYGGAWVVHRLTREGPPSTVLEKLDKLSRSSEEETRKPRYSEEDIRKTKDTLKEAYQTDVPPLPETLQYAASQMAVAWGEVVCGGALLLGLLTRVSALLMIVVQVGAIATVTWARGFAPIEGGRGYEYNFALLAMCLALVVLGGGVLSLDALWSRRRAAQAPATNPSPAPAGVV